MKVTFVDFGADIASSRLRASIPQRELAKIGVGFGKDVLIYGKHFVKESQLFSFAKRVFDVCDDHFNSPELSSYYKRHVEIADAVTCNSEVMRERIKSETGRDATVISEPYEGDEKEPDIGPLLYWFGHRSNRYDIERLAPSLKYPLKALSNYPGYGEWTPENHKEALEAPCIVVIPTGKSMAKSENRRVESIRSGRYVCAEHLPSYEKFSQFMPLGDIPSHIEKALDNEDKSLKAISDAQEFIRDRYSPKTIAKQWLELLNSL